MPQITTYKGTQLVALDIDCDATLQVAGDNNALDIILVYTTHSSKSSSVDPTLLSATPAFASLSIHLLCKSINTGSSPSPSKPMFEWYVVSYGSNNACQKDDSVFKRDCSKYDNNIGL
jgi:hypothetical protein